MTRRRLRQVALDLFREKGYQSTTTRDVAATLGVQQASLYYHMKNKEDLLHGICYSSLLQVVENTEAAAFRARDPREAIRAFTRSHLETTLEYQKEFSVGLMECRELGPDYRAEIEALWSRHAMFFYDLLDKARNASQIRTDLPNKYIYSPCICTLNWASLWFKAGRELNVPQLEELFSRILFEGAAGQDHNFEDTLSVRYGNVQGLQCSMEASGTFAPNLTYARMLDTACVLFARKGYFATSIREIAAAMGIQKASLYYYISSKEDLIYQISKTAHQHLSESVHAALEKVEAPEERLYAFILAHVVSLLQHQNWHAAANEEMTHAFSPERKAEVIALRDQYEQTARRVLADAQAVGFLRSDISTKYLSLVLFGMITNMYSWYQPGVDFEPLKLAQTIADVFLAGISRTGYLR